MTKPRFTPDPLPDGLDPSLASFLQRQFDRINDWWPKDLEDRVKALEKSYPYTGGTWPVVDYSTVEFNGSTTIVLDPDISCAQATGYPVESMAYMTSVLDVQAAEGAVIATGAISNTSYKGTTVFDVNAQTEIFSLTNCSRSGALLHKAPGSSTIDRVLISNWVCNATVHRYFRFYTWPGMGYLGQASMSLNNVIPQAETNDFIVGTGDFSTSSVRLINKSTFGVSTESLPTGWVVTSGGFAAQVSSTSILLSMKESATGRIGFAVYTPGHGMPTPTNVITIDGGNPIQVAGRPVVIGTSIYWPVTGPNGNNLRASIVKTDFSGAVQEVIPAYDTAVGSWSGAYSKITYSSNTNSLYYMSGAAIWKYSLTSKTYSQCTPAYPDGWTINQPRSTGLAYDSGHVWTVVPRYDSTKWGLERIKVEDL